MAERHADDINLTQEIKEAATSTAQRRSGERVRRIGLLGPFMCICAGILLLLNNFGVVPWSVWGALWRLWPLILIFVGMEIIFGRTALSNFIRIVGATIILVSMAAIVAGFYAVSHNGNFTVLGIHTKPLIDSLAGTTGQKIKEINVSDDSFKEIDTLDLRVKMYSQEMTLKTENSLNIFSSTATYNMAHLEPFLAQSLNGKKLTLEYGASEATPVVNFGAEALYDLRLGNPTLKTDLSIELSSGKVAADMTDLNLNTGIFKISSGAMVVDFGAITHKNAKNISASIGSGELTLRNVASVSSAQLNLEVKSGSATLVVGGESGAATFPVFMDVSSGSVELQVPKDTGVTISHKISSGSLTFDDFTTRGDGEYTSQNYELAESKINLRVTVRSGSISITSF